MFWCSNSVALKQGFPAQYLFANGYNLHYHFFSSVHVAWMSIISGVDVFSCSFPMYSLGKSCLYFAGFYLLIKSACKGFKNTTLFLSLVLFASPLPAYTDIVCWYLQKSSIGLDMGIAYGAAFVSYFFEARRENSLGKHLMSVITLFIMTGAKAPVAAVVLIIPIYYFLSDTFRKELKHALFEIILVMAFILAFLLCMGVNVNAEDMETASFGWFISFKGLEFYKDLQIPSNTFGSATAILNVLYMVLSYPVIFEVVLVGLISNYKKIDKYDEKDEIKAALISIICGLIMYLTISAGGRDERYFLYATYIPAFYLMVRYGNTIVESMQIKGKLFEIYLCTMALQIWSYASYIGIIDYRLLLTYGPALLIIALYVYDRFYRMLFCKDMQGNPQLLLDKWFSQKNMFSVILTASVAVGIGYFAFCDAWYSDGATIIRRSLKQAITAEVDEEFVNPEGELTEQDVEALRWIRDNTENGIIVINDSQLSDYPKKNRSNMYGVFSERQQWIEGDYMISEGNYSDSVKKDIKDRIDIIKRLYANEDSALETIQSLGEVYIVQTKRITPDFTISADKAEMVYENDSMSVYRLLSNSN